MRRVLVLLALVSASYARTRVDGYCQDGNKTITVLGYTSSSSSPVMRSYPSCTVTVYLAGTTTLASIYSDDSGTSKANPFTADSRGYWYFHADDGKYDIQLSGGGIPSAFTLGDKRLIDPYHRAKGSTTPYLISEWLYDQKLNVKAYGAKGDGTTDDTAAIQAAIDAAYNLYQTGGNIGRNAVFFPVARYRISSLTLRPGVALIGHGSVLEKTGSSTSPMLHLPYTPGVFAHNVVIEGLIILGNPSVAHNGISLEGRVATTGYISNVHVANCGGTGIYISQGNVYVLSNVWAIANVNKNIHIYNSDDIHMRSITAEGGNPAVTVGQNIHIQNSRNIFITDVHVELFNNLPAIYIQNSGGYTVDRIATVYFAGSGSMTVEACIQLDDSTQGRITHSNITVYNGTVTLNNHIKDAITGVGTNTWPGYPVTKTGYYGLGQLAFYSRGNTQEFAGSGDFAFYRSNLYIGTGHVANLPNGDSYGLYFKGMNLVGLNSGAGYINSNVKRRSDNSGFELMNSSQSGWIVELGASLDRFVVYRSPSGSYNPSPLLYLCPNCLSFGTSGGNRIETAGTQANMVVNAGSSGSLYLNYDRGQSVVIGNGCSQFTTDRLQVCGNVRIRSGGKLVVEEGTNACAGEAVLVNGTVTVNTTCVTTTSRIFLTHASNQGTLGELWYTKTPGVSFTINSTSPTDVSVVNWFIVN